MPRKKLPLEAGHIGKGDQNRNYETNFEQQDFSKRESFEQQLCLNQKLSNKVYGVIFVRCFPGARRQAKGVREKKKNKQKKTKKKTNKKKTTTHTHKKKKKEKNKDNANMTNSSSRNTT